MGIDRQLKRSMMKQKFEGFKRAWRLERAYQRFQIAQGELTEVGDDKGEGKHVGVDKDGNPVMILGRRPTFSAWLRSQENVRAARAEEKKVEVKDVEW